MTRLTIYPREKKAINRVDCDCSGGQRCNDPMCQVPINYLLGKAKPNYPVPATMFHSAIANYHNPEWSWQWAVEWIKARLKIT